MKNSLAGNTSQIVADALREQYALPATGDNISVSNANDKLKIDPVPGGVPLMGTTSSLSPYNKVSLAIVTSTWGTMRIPCTRFNTFAEFATAFYNCNMVKLEEGDLTLTFPLDLSDSPDGALIDIVATPTSLRLSGSTKIRTYLPTLLRLVYSVKTVALAPGRPIYLGHVKATAPPTPAVFDVTIGGAPAVITFNKMNTSTYTVVATLDTSLVVGETEIKLTSSIPFGTGSFQTSGSSEPTLSNGATYATTTITEITQDGISDSTLGFISPNATAAAIWIEPDALQKNRLPVDISGLFANVNIIEAPVGLFDNVAVSNAVRAFQGTRITVLRSELFATADLRGNWTNAFKNSGLVEIEEGCWPQSSTITNFFNTFNGCKDLATIEVNTLRHAALTCTNLGYAMSGTGLTQLPSGLLDGMSLVTSLLYTFYNSKLTSVPAHLLDSLTAVMSVEGVFASNPITVVDKDLFKYNTAITNLNNVLQATSLVEIPVGLFDSQTKATTVTYGFMNTTTLQVVPDTLFQKCTLLTTMDFCFYGCRNVETFPVGIIDGLSNLVSLRSAFELLGSAYRLTNSVTFPAHILAGKTKLVELTRAFMGCPFNAIEVGALDDCINVTSVAYLWGGASWSQAGAPFTEIPETLFSKCAKLTMMGGCFALSDITTVPPKLFTNCPNKANVMSLAGLFYGCSKLTSVPAGLFDGYTGVTDISTMFSGISKNSIVPIEDLPPGLFSSIASSVTTAEACFSCCGIKTLKSSYLQGSSKLTNVNNLFLNTVSLTTVEADAFKGCVSVSTATGAFNGCTGLTTLPDADLIPSPALSRITNMFNGCTALTVIYGRMFTAALQIVDAVSVFANTGLVEVPAGLFANKTYLGNMRTLFTGCESLQTIKAGWYTLAASGTHDFTAAFAHVHKDVTAEAGAFPVKSGMILVSLFGYGRNTVTGNTVGFSGNINRLDNAFTNDAGVVVSSVSDMLAIYPVTTHSANATLTGTAKNILTALGLNQTSMSAVFGPNPTVVWE